MIEETLPQAVQGSPAGEGASPQTAAESVCGVLLESMLSAARLPQALGERVRRQFSGRTIEPLELQHAVADARSLWSELTASQAVSGASKLLPKRLAHCTARAGSSTSRLISRASQIKAG